MTKKSVFVLKLYENHILYGCHGNMYGQKNIYLSKDKTWISYLVIILWCFEKDIRTLIFFQKFFKTYLEWYTSALGMEYLKRCFIHICTLWDNKLFWNWIEIEIFGILCPDRWCLYWNATQIYGFTQFHNNPKVPILSQYDTITSLLLHHSNKRIKTYSQSFHGIFWMTKFYSSNVYCKHSD